MKRPASQYYWGDWRRDTALQSCSLTARGLWHEMNCLMHDCMPYGHLMVGALPMQVAQLARLVGATAKECAALLAELEAAGVFSRIDDGTIYSRRMVRDEDLRERRAAGGSAGAEHGVKGAEGGKKGGRPKHNKGGSETPLSGDEKPPPAFASASATAKDKARSNPSPTLPAPLVDDTEEPSPESPLIAAAKAIAAAGIEVIRPKHDAGLQRLLDADVPIDDIAAVAVELVAEGKARMLLLLATVEGRRRDAADRGAVPVTPPVTAASPAASRTAAELAEDAGRWERIKADPDEKARVEELKRRARQAVTRTV